MYTEVVNLRDYDPEDKLTDEVSKLVLFMTLRLTDCWKVSMF